MNSQKHEFDMWWAEYNQRLDRSHLEKDIAFDAYVEGISRRQLKQDEEIQNIRDEYEDDIEDLEESIRLLEDELDQLREELDQI